MKKKKGRKNQQDLTLRNLRALKKKISKLEKEINVLFLYNLNLCSATRQVFVNIVADGHGVLTEQDVVVFDTIAGKKTIW